MHKALRIIFVVQVVLGAVWLLFSLTAGIRSTAGFTVFLIVFPVQLLFLAFAAWAAFRDRDCRRTAALVAVVPVASFLLSLFLPSLGGGPAVGGAATLLVLAGLGVVAAFPQASAALLPEWLFVSRGWNRFVLWVLIVAWALAILLGLAFLYFASTGEFPGFRRGTGSWAIFYAMLAIALYLVAVGCVSVLTGLFAYLGLNRGVPATHRGLHLAQALLSVPGVLAMLAVVWFWASMA